MLVIENKNAGATMSEIHLQLQRQWNGRWKVVGRSSESLQIAEYEADPELVALLAPYDERAKADAVIPIGELRGGNMAPDNEIENIPSPMVQDTALLDFINEVQLYYTGAQVSATAMTSMTGQMREGTIRKCDLTSIYTYENTLYKLQMNGAQLRDYMEWSAAFFKTWQPGDLTIAFDPSTRYYLYDAFEGVNYEIDISQEPGNRILNLTWPDGTRWPIPTSLPSRSTITAPQPSCSLRRTSSPPASRCPRCSRWTSAAIWAASANCWASTSRPSRAASLSPRSTTTGRSSATTGMQPNTARPWPACGTAA